MKPWARAKQRGERGRDPVRSPLQFSVYGIRLVRATDPMVFKAITYALPMMAGAQS